MMTDISHAELVSFRCEGCGVDASAEIWLVIDASHRIDLLRTIANGTLHSAFCQCGLVTTLDAPVLVYAPSEDPPVYFSPAANTTGEEDMSHAARLLAWVGSRLGDEWDDAWVFLTDPISRPELEQFVADNWVRLSRGQC